MGLREVRDAAGVAWNVFDVFPLARQLAPGRPTPRAAPALAPEMVSGWLAFHSEAGERRRVVPTPAGWERLSDADLLGLLARATSAGASDGGGAPAT